MFTGIIIAKGAVRELRPTDGGARLILSDVPFCGDLVMGESVAVNGCCLTVTEVEAETSHVGFDLLAETLRATNLGSLEPGSSVNLERALAVGERMSGHYVQGHVDTTAEVVAYEKRGDDHRLEVELPGGFAQYVAYKGSIAIDGISLTVAEVLPHSFVVWIIPHTDAVTNLHRRAAGERVNLEFDILAKYVERIAAVGAQPEV